MTSCGLLTGSLCLHRSTMERKSSTYSVVRTNLQVFGVASFLLLLTAAVEGLHVVPSVENVEAKIGQRVELYCRREVNSNANEISWLKNGLICFRLGFKENCNVMFNESYTTLVIASVEENDAGLYQCAFQSTNLTVLNISQASSTESSDSAYDLLQKVFNYTFANHVFLITISITILIGAGTIAVFLVWWWKGKSRQYKTNAGLQESEESLITEFKKLVDDVGAARCELHRARGEIIAKMVELNCKMVCTDKTHNDQLAEELKIMKEVYKKQSEDLEALWGNVVSKINKLEEKVSEYHGIVVHELKQQSNIVKRQDKAIKEIQEILQSWPSDKRSISVIDSEHYRDG